VNRALARERTALVLYVVLLVLPAVVLGALLSHRLWRDHQLELAAVPDRCTDAARRMAEVVAYRLETRLDEEGDRPFFHFQEQFLGPFTKGDVAFEQTPLIREPRPPGVLGWFTYDSYGELSTDGAQYFFGKDPALDESQLRRIVKRDLTREEVTQLGILEDYVSEGIAGEYKPLTYTYRVLGVNLHPDPDGDCRQIPELGGEWNERLGQVRVTPMILRAIELNTGERYFVAERLVYLPGEPLPDYAPQCLQHLAIRRRAYQGVVLDPVWLFEDLPREVARLVLDPSQRLVPASEAAALDNEDVVFRQDNFFGWLPQSYRVEPALELGELYVATDRTELGERFRVQLGWLAGVAGVLALSMGVGVSLLVGRIRTSSEEALRTRNFVAAVTHELRTPIASVKLYGEMLADGWIQDSARRQSYIERIVRETDRLSALVDRVLLRRRLQDQPPVPTAGDLNRDVEAQRSELELVGGEVAHDLAFDLAPNLPPVLLVPDGVHVILTNLVENARKYAPVDVDRPGAEPILVRTRREGRAVVLDVLDRGPGVREAERKRIFDAFYRPGDERTRSTTGTGLGLHLVALQARAMRGRVEVLAREGGGSVFRFTFRVA
jgi:signal transduction histidine kinase